jgi:hypothetical protein
LPKELGVRVFDLRETYAFDSEAEHNACRPAADIESAAPKTRAQPGLVTQDG